mgnify:CR=1 FL=1
MRGVGLIIVVAGVVIGAGVAIVFGAFPTRTDIREIDFSRSGCFGRCPGYEVTFRSDGCAVLVGDRNTLLVGRYTGIVPFQKLAILVESRHFWDLHNQYAMNVEDTPGMKLRVVKASMTKVVETRASDSWEVPVDFYEIGKLIDGFVFTTYWFSNGHAHNPSEPGRFDVMEPSKYVPNCV